MTRFRFHFFTTEQDRCVRSSAQHFLVAVFASALGLPILINGIVSYRGGKESNPRYTTFTNRDLEYVLKTYHEQLKDRHISVDAYAVVIDELQRSNSMEDAKKNIEATRKKAVAQKGTAWIRPSNNAKKKIQTAIRASIESADEGTRRIPFTPELTTLIGAPGLIHVEADGYCHGCTIFADGKPLCFKSVKTFLDSQPEASSIPIVLE
jgi:hypothetical protein